MGDYRKAEEQDVSTTSNGKAESKIPCIRGEKPKIRLALARIRKERYVTMGAY